MYLSYSPTPLEKTSLLAYEYIITGFQSIWAVCFLKKYSKAVNINCAILKKWGMPFVFIKLGFECSKKHWGRHSFWDGGGNVPQFHVKNIIFGVLSFFINKHRDLCLQETCLLSELSDFFVLFCSSVLMWFDGNCRIRLVILVPN